MSDCASIRLRMSSRKTDSIWVYSHDHGSRLPGLLQVALSTAKPRWGLPSYCARVIVDQLIHQPGNTTLGWGLNVVYDNSYYNVFELDMEKQTVQVRKVVDTKLCRRLVGRAVTFEEFVVMEDAATYRTKGTRFVGDEIIYRRG